MALPTAYLMAAPEATGIFTRERLQSMTFETAEVAYKHLRVEAMRCGFTIATNQSKRSNYMTIHCGKGGRVRGNDTKKTGCPFRLYLTPREEDGRCVIRAECVEHNHPLTPDKYSIFTLAPDKQDLIRKMLDSGVAPNAIQRFLERSGETGVSTLQIRRLAGRDKAFQNRETEDLRRYMEDVGGVFKRMEIRLDEKCYVHAVFTAMDFEVENMRRFADVIWLDGTQRQNYLKWEIIPITLIDSFKRIRSGGCSLLVAVTKRFLSGFSMSSRGTTRYEPNLRQSLLMRIVLSFQPLRLFSQPMIQMTNLMRKVRLTMCYARSIRNKTLFVSL